jgi:hypothetical protein
MIKTIMVGSVGITRPAEMFTAKPPHVPKPDELVLLRKRYRACLEYADAMIARSTPKISRAAHSSAAEAIRIKRYLDMVYKRWWMEI